MKSSHDSLSRSHWLKSALCTTQYLSKQFSHVLSCGAAAIQRGVRFADVGFVHTHLSRYRSVSLPLGTRRKRMPGRTKGAGCLRWITLSPAPNLLTSKPTINQLMNGVTFSTRKQHESLDVFYSRVSQHNSPKTTSKRSMQERNQEQNSCWKNRSWKVGYRRECVNQSPTFDLWLTAQLGEKWKSNSELHSHKF